MQTVNAVAEFLVHPCGYEEVGDDIIALSHFVTQFDARRAHALRLAVNLIEDVEVPLDYVPGICVLLVDAFVSQFVTHLVVL